MKRSQKERCFYCDKPSVFGLTHPRCKRKNGIDGHISVYKYDGLFKKLLLESKYKGALLVLTSLLGFNYQKTHLNLNFWSTLFSPTPHPVPLHNQRLKERGFNQSEIICNHFFPLHEGACAPLLKRTINTDHLATIGDKFKRIKHIKGAFSHTGNPIPKSIVLVDDVITSGATILECARSAKDLGVQTVLAFSLAKG